MKYDDIGIMKLRDRIKEEFEYVRDLGNRADIISAMTNVDSLIKYLLEQRTTANVRFGFLKKILTQITKVTSYIRKRCAK